jgi:putative peptidoglycan lipid II flippase
VTLSTSEHRPVVPQPNGVRLARSAGLSGAATLTSRVLGLVRDQVLAALFGAGNEMDAFIVAFRIPNFVRDLFGEGAMSAAFVPTFTRHLTRYGKKDAWRLGNNVMNALMLITASAVLVGMVFARPIVTAYAGDYANVPGKLELTIQLTRVVLPFLTFVAVAAAMMGMLNSLHHYFIPALAPAAFNIATIVCAFTLVPLMPAIGLPRIMAIAVAAVIGGLGQVALQWLPLRREGFTYTPSLNWHDAGLRQVLILMGPGTIGLAATQVNIFVNTLLATTQGTGAVSWLTFAFRLMYLPIGLFGVSIGTAVLPAVSRHAATDDLDGVRDTVSRGLAMMLMLNVPATLGLLALATPIVRLLFERGHFQAADTAQTAAAVQFYALGLVGYSTVRIVSPTFYALHRSRVPVVVSACAIAVNIVLSVALVRTMGFRGLALGTSLAALFNAALLVWLLRRELNRINGASLAIAMAKTVIAGLIMTIVAVGVDAAMRAALPGGHFTLQAARLGTAIVFGLLALALSAKLLRIREFDEAVSAVRTIMAPRRGEEATDSGTEVARND